MAVHPLRQDILAERALAAGGAEHVEIPPAVSQRIVGIAVAVEPDRRSLEGAAATEDLRIDLIDGGATIAQPSADEVHDGARHRGLPAAPGNGKDAAARHAADGDPLAIDKGLRQKHRRNGIDVAEGAFGAGERPYRVAAVALCPVGLEAFVIDAFRATAPATRGQDDGPAACREPAGQRLGIVRPFEERRVTAATGRAVMEDQGRERPVAGRLVGDRSQSYLFAVDRDRHHCAFLRGERAGHDEGDAGKKKRAP